MKKNKKNTAKEITSVGFEERIEQEIVPLNKVVGLAYGEVVGIPIDYKEKEEEYQEIDKELIMDRKQQMDIFLLDY